MADFDSCRRFLNPCLLHLQKMQLELKCPACLKLLNQPMLLPCNHIFCRACISGQSKFESRCLLCKLPYGHQDLRPIPHMETMVRIYKSMDAAFGAKLFQSTAQVHPSGNVDDGNVSTREHAHGLRKENSNNKRKRIGSIPSNKRIRASPDHATIEVETPESPSKSSKERNNGEGADNVELSVHNGKSNYVTEAVVSDGDPTLPSFSSCSYSKCEEQLTHGRDLPELEMALNYSPHFGDNKDSDYDSSDQVIEHCEEWLSMPIAAAEASRKLCIRTSISSPEGDGTRVLKRQKSDQEPHDMPSSPNSTTATMCEFCQSSKVTKASGPMLHYLNGTAVEEDKAIQSSTLHVHKKCVEWAPQVYFVGETVVNLEAELARGAKIKCSSCGNKGAALGCYAKSCRRSFHVPCAVEILKCRWDLDNFLMLCPTHSHLKLPNERSKSAKRKGSNMFSATQLEYQQTSGDCPSLAMQNSAKFRIDSSKGSSEWVLCGSALSSEDKELLSEFVALTGVKISKVWNANVTHVIASTDEKGACSRTLKFLMAILNGRWILKIDWIKACMEANRLVCEEPYEISCDIHGSQDGPKNGRIRIMEKAPKLLNGLSFYFSGDFMPSYKGCLQDLVVAGGGTILLAKDMAPCNFIAGTAKTTFVMYNQDPPKAHGSVDSCHAVERRQKDAEAIACGTGSQVVGHAWLLDSIAACSLLPIC